MTARHLVLQGFLLQCAQVHRDKPGYVAPLQKEEEKSIEDNTESFGLFRGYKQTKKKNQKLDKMV